MTHSVCVITGSRAEYGLLRKIMRLISDDPELSLQVIVTGTHLSPEFGMTFKEIEADGFVISHKVEMLTSSDTSVGVAKSIGLATIGFADALQQLTPDMVIVLGDRFEILAAAQTAMIMQIPIAHIGGGDISGTYDNVIRHCITKMSNLHFVTHSAARDRVIQLGERDDSIFCFGSTCVDNVKETKLLDKLELEEKLGIKLKSSTIVVTYHPLTSDRSDGNEELEELLSALDELSSGLECSIVFTKSNADNGGRALNLAISKYVSERDNSFLFDSLGQIKYLSLVSQASIAIGNSSSGIYEAPYLGTATVNIGPRQSGREAPSSVIHCRATKEGILKAIRKATSISMDDVDMIYGNGDTSTKIVNTLKKFIGSEGLSVKSFVDLEFSQ